MLTALRPLERMTANSWLLMLFCPSSQWQGIFRTAKNRRHSNDVQKRKNKNSNRVFRITEMQPKPFCAFFCDPWNPI
jgi:hypothetical protein